MRNLRGVFWLLVICLVWLLVWAAYFAVWMCQALVDGLLWLVMPWLDDSFFEDLE